MDNLAVLHTRGKPLQSGKTHATIHSMTPPEKAAAIDKLSRAIIQQERLDRQHQALLSSHQTLKGRLECATQANHQLQTKIVELQREIEMVREDKNAKQLRLRVRELTSEVLVWQRKWNAERQKAV